MFSVVAYELYYNYIRWYLNVVNQQHVSCVWLERTFYAHWVYEHVVVGLTIPTLLLLVLLLNPASVATCESCVGWDPLEPHMQTTFRR